jgi:hypothetical protein
MYVSVAVGDFNGDSDPDLAVANRIGTVSVLLSDGGGGFAGADTFFVGDQPFSVAVGDSTPSVLRPPWLPKAQPRAPFPQDRDTAPAAHTTRGGRSPGYAQAAPGPGLYRLTVRAHQDHKRLSRPVRRYLRLLD